MPTMRDQPYAAFDLFKETAPKKKAVPKAVKKTPRLPMGPHTPTLKAWLGIKARTSDKARRKSDFSVVVDQFVTPADCTRDQRLSMYEGDPAKYATALKWFKSFGAALAVKNLDVLSTLYDVRTDAAMKADRQRALITGKALTEANPDWFFCDLCGKFEKRTEQTAISRFHSQTYCSVCVGGRRVVLSPLMNDWVIQDHMERGASTRPRLHNGDYEHATREWFIDNGWTWIAAYNTWLTTEVMEALGVTEDGSSVIGDYHSSKRIVGRIPSEYDKRRLPLLMGLELEMEVVSGVRTELALKMQKLMGTVRVGGRNHRYCALERDGSIANGFEMVTGYTGLDTHALALSRLKDMPFRGKLTSHDTTTCGLHVHIDRNNLTPLHADKMALFINAPANRKLILAVARRYNNGTYAKIMDKTKAAKSMGTHTREVKRGVGIRSGATVLRPGAVEAMRKSYREIISQGTGNADRYQAINFTLQKTIEFRVYRGTLKYETIMSCLEFTRAVWLFSQEFSRTEMTVEKFLAFICRSDNRPDTLHLRPYLQGKGFLPKERSDVVIPAGRMNSESVLQSEDHTEGLPKPVVNPKRIVAEVRAAA